MFSADSQILPESHGNSHAWLRVLRHPSPLWPTGGQEKRKTKTLKENTAWDSAERAIDSKDVIQGNLKD
jgi:hypothetical protein